MEQKYIDLYDEYTHSTMPRREFIARLGKLAGSSALAFSLLPLLENNYAQAAVVSPEDKRLQTGYITYPGHTSNMRAYMAQPVKTSAPQSAVIVIHENKGLHPHIEDITRRIALAGYMALAPDALSPLGGTPEDPEQAKALFPKLSMSDTIENYRAAFAYLDEQPETSGNWGCVGFCWGGGLANQLAVHEPALDAAVSFYGRQPEAADVSKIKSAVQLHYAGLDQRINAGMAAYEDALKANHIDYEQYVYEGVNHAFNNDTNEARYNKAAADLAWERTLAFLNKHLGAS
ncbi:dienelactone hydrolase family protein [Pokkaliibacter sp. CJK22405]|uniref:dienelactone hydrolase family protein n=1 Tax=Pokkaliibacter sp. CJK22405 TaxID=3384615 RepID=UPI00398513A7